MRNRSLFTGLILAVAVVAVAAALMRLRVPRGPVLVAELRTGSGLRYAGGTLSALGTYTFAFVIWRPIEASPAARTVPLGVARA